MNIASDKIGNPLLIELLRKLTDVFSGLNRGYFIIGATARDLILLQLEAGASTRRTRDLDISIAIPDWDAFEEIERTLVASGFEKDIHVRQRFYYKEYELDLMPYGEVAKDAATGEREYVMIRRNTEHIVRCHWCNNSNPRYVAYHDTVWGRAEHDDCRLFAMFLPETFQAGLSWECLLNKMEAFRLAFDNFDPHKIVAYDERRVDVLMQDKGIIRNRSKIEAAIVNARIFMEIQQECGTFDRYIWGFTEGKTIYETGITTSPLSDAIAKDLRRRGMKFIGSTTVYAYLQAIGVINAHEPQCWCYKTDRQ